MKGPLGTKQWFCHVISCPIEPDTFSLYPEESELTRENTQQNSKIKRKMYIMVTMASATS